MDFAKSTDAGMGNVEMLESVDDKGEVMDMIAQKQRDEGGVDCFDVCCATIMSNQIRS